MTLANPRFTKMSRDIRCRRVSALAAALAMLSGCTAFSGTDQGLLQPQMVTGPCQVAKFYLLSHVAVHTTMTVDRGAQACSFTVLNPDLQQFPSAALVTQAPAHGTATAALANSGRSPTFSYTPQPGTVGPDRFAVTFEPNDHAIIVAVTVR